jgi:hypothetical protein
MARPKASEEMTLPAVEPRFGVDTDAKIMR